MRWLLLALVVALVFAGVAAMASLMARLRPGREGAARLIEGYADGRVPAPEWDRFTSMRQVDAQIEEARVRCVEIAERHYAGGRPPSHLSSEGAERLRELARWLRENDEPG